MMENTKQRKVGDLTLTGELTISRAAELLAVLKETLGRNQEVLVRLSDVTALDVSCLQLLCSAHRTAAALNKVLALDGPLPERFRKIMQRAGFKRRNGCAFSPKTKCLCYDGGE
jgi:ABC-type transporter Mla MlaB component